MISRWKKFAGKIGLACFICIAPHALVGADRAHQASEMERYRQIEESQSITCQDMVDLILMVQGEFAKHTTAEKRLEHARREGWVKKLQATDKVDRGHLAFALIQNFSISRGWLFRLTKWNRYALRDVQQAGILSVRYGSGSLVSGAELVGAVSAAEDYQVEKTKWSENH